MLSQTGGTLARPVDYSAYTDAKHYKLETPSGERALYGMVLLSESAATICCLHILPAVFGQFYLGAGSLKVVIDTEDLELQPGETWELEEFTFRSDETEAICSSNSPTGSQQTTTAAVQVSSDRMVLLVLLWTQVTAQQVLDNLEFIAKRTPGLRYVQIDDGYQPAMGDWLETGSAFGGNVQSVLKAIRQRGFEPAIWVAPFVAEEGSHLFQQHPDWFVKGSDGKPLRSDHVTFGGWRRGPWYALDGTNPEAQRHREHVFRTMREEWGCTYFKLDANFWGRARRTPLRCKGHPRRSIPPGYGGGHQGSREQFHTRMQSADVGLSWINSRLSQLERYQEELGSHRQYRPSEPEPQLAERASLVERSGRCGIDRRPLEGRDPLSRISHPRIRWNAALG